MKIKIDGRIYAVEGIGSDYGPFPLTNVRIDIGDEIVSLSDVADPSALTVNACGRLLREELGFVPVSAYKEKRQ